ncbi:LamB/YcsF family protein [Metabacillus litoralis]|uniref:LamB/YcsF family protein n=1 Tax=Metabacillus litoralis TaxID=152268 RepID=UPI00203C2AE9|nr:5-oxoprolinase subunit PxpA [Metabacillus litoralis]MCM3160766.1 LamB/YcsF family protein [Metabacillus litoralis]
MAKKIDLNCDMGESFGAYKLGMDEEVIKLISSANIACGFHAGDPNVMDQTVAMAKEYNVGIGVHIGYPDLLGFGRRDIDISRKDLMNYIIYQIGALEAFCRKHHVEIQHVKAHGSMGNMSFVNRTIADAIVDAVYEVLPETKIFVLPGTEIHKASEEKGLSSVLEVFADRAYNNDLTLVSRKIPGSVITDPQEAAENVLRMIIDGKAKTIDGEFIDIKADSVCVHGDTQGALDIVRFIRKRIEEEQIEIASVGKWHN